jgi:hypothetical protein
MPPLLCPRCQRPNPELAQFCHFDGAELGSGKAAATVGRLHKEFVFPSGKRCRTFDDLAQACQDDWAAARDLLRQGAFVDYFSSVGRMDLARAAQESMANANPDIGLSDLVTSLPQSRTQGPKLDIHPRRLVLGSLPAGEIREVPLVITNDGQGLLQGTLTVAEGGEWLRIHASQNGKCDVQTPREQQVLLEVDTRNLPAGKAYGARLTIVTNGGIVELPARMELTAHPFHRPPFQGVRTPRELAERMRTQPKAAVPLLESGEISRWFATNGWKYPVRGVAARGVAGVQQFFENMGLSKPPTVQLSKADVFHTCRFPEGASGQVALRTAAKKWVFGHVESDAPWLKVLTPDISGPQQAQIGYEIDVRQTPTDGINEAHLTVQTNGEKKLTLRALVEVEGRRPSLKRRLLQPVVTCAVAFFLLRLLLVPVLDVYGRGIAANEALARIPSTKPAQARPSLAWGGWLNVSWTRVYFDPQKTVLDDVLGPATATQENRTRDFRDYFTGRLMRVMIGSTWWIGAIAGVFVLWRRGNVADAPWGLVAGAAAGLAVSATLGSMVIVLDLGPHFLWDLTFEGTADGLLLLPLWVLIVLAWWTGIGIVLGMALTLLGPLGRPLLKPLQAILQACCRLIGLQRLGDYFAPVQSLP